MRRDDLVIGGLMLLMVFSGRRAPVPWGSGWMWPVPTLVPLGATAYPAEISQEFSAPNHYGVDIAYRRKALSDGVTVYPPGTHDGTARYFSPPGTPIVAARDGTVWSTSTGPRGIAVVLDHGKPFATFYQHLASTSLPKHASGKQANGGAPLAVRAGDVIGTMGYDPTDPEGFRHLHFAVWFDGAGDAASVDPWVAMESSAVPWSRVTWRGP
jgi:murein DD-endopeptidase MepM/ murein hydrolase activator NlpD